MFRLKFENRVRFAIQNTQVSSRVLIKSLLLRTAGYANTTQFESTSDPHLQAEIEACDSQPLVVVLNALDPSEGLLQDIETFRQRHQEKNWGLIILFASEESPAFATEFAQRGIPTVFKPFSHNTFIAAIAKAMDRFSFPATLANILLVDDDRSTCDFIRDDVLRERGFRRVAIAHSYDEAMVALTSNVDANNKIDVVISDFKMPEKSGLDLLKRLRSDQDLKGLPFIFMSGFFDKDAIVQAKNLGVRELMVKPVNASNLISSIMCEISSSSHKKAG